MTQVIAVDWSGRAKGAAESIWTATVVDGRLVELENGMDRHEAVASVIGRAERNAQTVVGFDFAFSFPSWFCEREGWKHGREVWADMRDRAEQLLAACEPPFWGRTGTKAQQLGDPFRRTDRDVGGQPKSVFQIGGAGAVGTGSLRGMRHLADLAEAGFAIWPFDAPCWPRVVEIYPRVFAPAVIKSRHRSRRDHLEERLSDQDPVLLERAAGSEDAFDATVAALAMARNVSELENLSPFSPGSPQLIEGCIWTPRSVTDLTVRGTGPA